MATSKTKIGNMALMNVGEDRVDDIETDTHKRAKIVREFYDQIRDLVLAAYPWAFAGKRVQLARSSTAPLFGYLYAYEMPSDYLSMRKPKKVLYDNSPVFLVEGDFLLTDEESITISYTYRHTNVADYTPGFVQSFVYRLSAAIAIPLTRKRTLAEDMMNLYRDMEIESFELESKEHNDEEVDEMDDLINV